MSKDTVFEKATNLCQTVRWEILDVIVVSVFRIISANSKYLVIFLTLFVLTINKHARKGRIVALY